jgi:hypothetical protein
MSDEPNGPGWRLGDDGKWYPPEQPPPAKSSASYDSLDEILADRRMGFVTDDQSAAGVKRAIERRLMELQPSTVEETSDEYVRLTAAREFLDDEPRVPAGRPGTAMEAVPSQMLDRLVTALVERTTPSEPPPLPAPPPEQRMAVNRREAATKASKDFRNARAIPIAGLGGLVAAVWGTRAAFGVDFSHVGTLVWSIVALGAVGVSMAVFGLARSTQGRAEVALRRLYDPDVQTDALRELLDQQKTFIRADYRDALSFLANPFSRHRLVPFRRHARLPSRDVHRFQLSTVDYASALEDAVSLALERFFKLGVLDISLRLAQEVYRPTDEYFPPAAPA